MVATLVSNKASHNGTFVKSPIKIGTVTYIIGGGAIPPLYLSKPVTLSLYKKELVLSFAMIDPRIKRVFRIGLRQISRIPDDNEEQLTIFFINNHNQRDEVVFIFEETNGAELVISWKAEIWYQTYEYIREQERRRDEQRRYLEDNDAIHM